MVIKFLIAVLLIAGICPCSAQETGGGSGPCWVFRCGIRSTASCPSGWWEPHTGGCFIPGSPQNIICSMISDGCKDIKDHYAYERIENTIPAIEDAASGYSQFCPNNVLTPCAKKSHCSKCRVIYDSQGVWLEQTCDLPQDPSQQVWVDYKFYSDFDVSIICTGGTPAPM
jgi:hypothetical protein